MLLLPRAIIFYIGYWLFTIVYGLLALPLLILPRSFASTVMISWNGLILFWLRVCCGVKVCIHGDLKKIPKACVIVANHQSPWETFFLQRKLFPLSTILKKELLRLPFFGWGLRLMDPIAIDRSNPVQALKQIKKISHERLQKNKKIMIFPEGTRLPPGKVGAYKRSAADIAKEAGVPLIPIAHNAGEHWLDKDIIKKPGVIQLYVGDSVDMSDKNTKEAMQDIENWTQQQLNG
jgi:1-acyl-sn-glycerol-3-phosphate acyltransferase